MPQEVEELFVSKIKSAFPSADTEQVIQVPKILDNTIPLRPVLMAAQMAEKLVGFPSPSFANCQDSAAGGEANL